MYFGLPGEHMANQQVKKTSAFTYPALNKISMPMHAALPQAVTVSFLLLTDAIFLCLSLLMGWEIRLWAQPLFLRIFQIEAPINFYHHLVWVLCVAVVYFILEGLYISRLPYWREARRLLKSVTLSFLFIMAAISLGKMSDEFSRTVLVLCYLASLILLPLGRYIAKTLLWHCGLWARPVLILGAGKTGELVARALWRDHYLGYKILGFLDDDPDKKHQGLKVNGTSFPVLGRFNDSENIMKNYGVRDLVLAAPGMPPRKLVELVNRLQRSAKSVLVIPDLFGLPVTGVKADYFFDEQVLSFRVGNNLANPYNMLLKRLFDLIVGICIFIFILPLMIVIAVAIKFDSPGPVLFGHRRIGRNGKQFICYKFRSMISNAQEILSDVLVKDPCLQSEWENNYKLKNDPRITGMGNFLRRTSLDELPQIFNVFKGEMSLVGPRPITETEVPYFDYHITDFYLVRPGITGYWQVSGRSEMDYPRRVELESWYVRNWSLWLDITLLIRTLAVVMGGRGAY
ncbi:MAG: undecaprenyl-phosphate galactose phosphotransferase WbaP [Eubacteriales bacterium]